MSIKNLALAAAAAVSLSGAAPDKPKESTDNVDNGRSVPMAPEVTGPKDATHDDALVAAETSESEDVRLDGEGNPPDLIAKILQECPDPDAMIAKQDPELHALLKAEHPEMLQASVIGELLSGAFSIVKLLYGILGGEGTIIAIILMSIFGVVPVLKKTFGVGKWTVDKLTGKREPEALGEVIPKGDLPKLNDVLSEVVDDPVAAMTALTPAGRAALTEHYDYVIGQFENVRFKEQSDGIGIFKLAIKAKYLALRIGELETALAAGPNPALEAEMAALITKEIAIAKAIADNPLNVASVRSGTEKDLTKSLQAKLKATTPAAPAAPGMPVPVAPAAIAVATPKGIGARTKAALVKIGSIKIDSVFKRKPKTPEKAKEDAVKDLVVVPRLHDLGTDLREIKIMESKLTIWKGRYDAAMLIAGPKVAAPAATAPAAVREKHRQNAGFIAIYDALNAALTKKKDELSRLQKGAKWAGDIMPQNPGRRALVKAGLIVGGGYVATKVLEGAGAVADIISPPEPPTPRTPSEADELEDRLERQGRKETDSAADRANDSMGKDSKNAVDNPF